ncbi:hypothetical protein KUL72_12885 [Bradyrhizobium arachidis]|uniref:hypothetical protein n=1 Tax=Bradyrhizobium arachidis TaxID=858423 RepID=UPI0021631CC2|nr:hypothetical protein [Bradyrhizobium arachidis]UVO39176.1 hypothetical protein KUL72_12885 [Bradyrhizobium arachidis]
MAIRQYIADSSALFAFDLPVSQMAVPSRLVRLRLVGSPDHPMRTDGDLSPSSIAIH